jgi:hypothetical protein
MQENWGRKTRSWFPDQSELLKWRVVFRLAQPLLLYLVWRGLHQTNGGVVERHIVGRGPISETVDAV